MQAGQPVLDAPGPDGAALTVAYRGPAALATALVALLGGEGLDARAAPTRNEHPGGYADEVVIHLFVTGRDRSVVVERAAKAAVSRFADRFPGVTAAIESLQRA
jgi:hypothetical protein